MKVLIFDLDDTLLMSNSYNKYSDIKPNNLLNYKLYNLQNPKFIYTNGTKGHGQEGLDAMGCIDSFKNIYARDNLPFMKPDFKSFNYVNNSIYFDYGYDKKRIFFDDLPNNLYTAYNLFSDYDKNNDGELDYEDSDNEVVAGQEHTDAMLDTEDKKRKGRLFDMINFAKDPSSEIEHEPDELLKAPQGTKSPVGSN